MYLASKRILLIDDEPDLLEMLANQFEGTNIEVVCAQNGQEGLAAIRKHRFDVVVSDVFMPEMNGLEFIQKLKQYGVDTRLMVLTGGGIHQGQDVRSQLQQMGVNVYTKPSDFRKLVEAVKQLCNAGHEKRAV